MPTIAPEFIPIPFSFLYLSYGLLAAFTGDVAPVVIS